MAVVKKIKRRFSPGQRIRVRGQDWQVEAAKQFEESSDVWTVEARALNGICEGQTYCFMTDIDTDIEFIDAADIEPVLASKAKSKLFFEANLRRLLPRNGALYLGTHGAVSPFDYQLRPAAHALNMDRARLLIGDAVGLGKTIECGVLLSELMRRGKARRVLCAVPKAILEQFQNEMWGRFSIPFHRLDSKGIQKLRQDLPSAMNPFYHYDKAIVSIDTLKIKAYQKWLEDCDWDVLIIDECHNVADRTKQGRGSARHRTASRIAQRANSVILMSATPHDGTKKGFASLIKLLDRTKIKNDEEFTFEDFDQHFIRRTRNTDYIKEELAEQNIGTRRQDVQPIAMSEKEINLLMYLHELDKRSDYFSAKKSNSKRGAKELFKTTLIKSFLSSPAALKDTVSKKVKNLEKLKTTDTSLIDNAKTALNDILVDIDELGSSTRLEYLADFIQKQPPTDSDRLVIFTERIATMDAISKFLVDKGIVDGLFDPKNDQKSKDSLLATAKGSMSDTDLSAIVKSFQSSGSGVRILVATNVASEGLNLHQNSHRLVHFDLPWSLITLEQRNGRIDRLGQTKTPEIYYFASVANRDTKEVKQTELKDDFWIVDKIKTRIETASQDMAEEALSKFVDAGSEEITQTKAYEEGNAPSASAGEIGGMMSQSDLLDAINNNELAEIKGESPKRKKLPTLYEKSPSDFVMGVCKESGSDLVTEAYRTTALSVENQGALTTEIKSWPREYRPSAGKPVILEQDKTKMIKHYEDRVMAGDKLDKSFLNEIHPLMHLLENTAMGLFPGKEVPTLALKTSAHGDKADTLYYLVQSTLYNKRNDVVMQYWQVLRLAKGSTKMEGLFDMQDNDHAIEICDWLNKSFKGIKQKKELSQNEARRLKKQTHRAVEIMAEMTKECRSTRAGQLKQKLKTELERIKTWESERRSFLTSQIEGKDDKHRGVINIQSAARRERDQIERDSTQYKDFINKFLTTSSEADVRILGCLLTEE